MSILWILPVALAAYATSGVVAKVADRFGETAAWTAMLGHAGAWSLVLYWLVR